MSVFIEKTSILSKTEISPGLYVFRLAAPKIAESARPGQFVQIDPGDRFFLRRPFSIQDADGAEIELLIKVVGKGTAALVQLEGPWDVIGPLGTGFTLKRESKSILVGGGVGVAPLKMLYRAMARGGLNPAFYVGARAAGEIPFAPDDPVRDALNIATDDGSEGFRGTVVECLKAQIAAGDRLFIYACGPSPMLAALREFMLERGLDGEFSLENRMACGMGVCQGCALPVEEGYKLVCKEGPVLPFSQIDERILSPEAV